MGPPDDFALAASELRDVIGRLVRRLRTEHGLPISQGMVLGRLELEGTSSVSELAVAERVRPQSMAQTVGDLETAGYVTRRPDPLDGRRALVEMTADGQGRLDADRRDRASWLAQTIADEFSPAEQARLMEAIPLLRRLAES